MNKIDEIIEMRNECWRTQRSIQNIINERARMSIDNRTLKNEKDDNID